MVPFSGRKAVLPQALLTTHHIIAVLLQFDVHLHGSLHITLSHRFPYVYDLHTGTAKHRASVFMHMKLRCKDKQYPSTRAPPSLLMLPAYVGFASRV